MGRQGGGQQGGGGGEELARAMSLEGRGDVRRVDKKEWGGEGKTGLGQWGGDWEGVMGRERGGNLKGDMGGGQWEGGDGRGQRVGEKKGQEKGAFHRWI